MHFSKTKNSAAYSNIYLLGEGVTPTKGNWTNNNSPNYATINPFYVTGKRFCASLSALGSWFDLTIPVVSKLYIGALVRFGAIGTQNQFLNFQDSDVTYMATTLQTNGTITFAHGTANNSTTTTISANTNYWMWWDYEAGSGANGKAFFGFNTTGLRPSVGGGNTVILNNGTSTNSVSQIDFENPPGATTMYVAGLVYSTVHPIGSYFI
jgi:hypothetical protein